MFNSDSRNSLAQKKLGLPPGSILHISNQKCTDTKIHLIRYNEHLLLEKDYDNLNEVILECTSDTVNWINLEGFGRIEIFEELATLLHIDKLVIEDILDPESRPKFEEYENYSFAIAKMLYVRPDVGLILHEQISFILKDNILITVQHEYGDVFDKIRERIRTFGGRIRTRKTDYLFYALMDIIVDQYFVVIEKFDDKIQDIEDKLFASPESKVIPEIRQMKKDIITMRQAAFPLREAVNAMIKTDTRIFDKKTVSFLKELYEHTIISIENIENSRELTSGLMDIYLSIINKKMANVSKVLTIIATIFIPLTFITSIYGMNFDVLPGKDEPSGFWILILFMTLITIGMLIWFRFKKWM
jgi:magnesium transporter